MRIIKIIFVSLLAFGCLQLVAQGSDAWNQKDQSGNKIGKWRGYYPGGALRYEGRFSDDQPIDTFQYFYRDGKLQTLLTYVPDTIGKALAVHFYQNGDTLAKGYFFNQMKTGIWRTYGENSVLLSTGLYKADKQNGKWVTYYPSGSIAEEKQFKDGIENGPFKMYFEDGQIKQDAFFLNGALHGQITYYQENGKKEQEGEYVQDLRDGKWFLYNEKGLLDKTLKYEKGKLLNPEVLEEGDYNKEEFKDQRKDRLEFEDLREKTTYE